MLSCPVAMHILRNALVMSIKNLRIGTKLTLGFGLIVALMIINMVVTVSKITHMNDATKMIVENRMPKIEKILGLATSVNATAIALRNMLLTDDSTDRSNQEKVVKAIRSTNKEIYDDLIPVIKKPAAKAALDHAIQLEQRYIAGQDKLIGMILLGNNDEAKTYLKNELRPLLEEYRRTIDDFVTAQKVLMQEAVNESNSAYETTIKLSAFLIFASLILATLIAYKIKNSITKPLTHAVAVANTVARGDLTSTVTISSNDELGELLTALQKMNDALLGTVTKVRTATETISTASSEIASGTLDLSSRTEQQASSLEETAASLEELTSTVKQNADNAQTAEQLATTASLNASRGGDVVEKVVATMSAINTSSKRVADIISVIDGIAFQTNILALNAAVEAARAGEQGRGFAVVASEVRNLAQRSAAAAKEIKVLIDESVTQVDDGTKLVSQAGETMREIVNSIQRVSTIISEISTASNEQRSGIEQINIAVMQMDSVTQQNAALVEEASAAADSMDSEAKNLAAAVATFKTGSESNKPMHATTRPSSAMKKQTPTPRLHSSSKGQSNEDWEQF